MITNSNVLVVDYATVPKYSGQTKPVWLDRQITPVMYLWSTPENSTDRSDTTMFVELRMRMLWLILLICLSFLSLYGGGVGLLHGYETSTRSYSNVKTVYEEEFQRAADEDQGRTPLKLQPSLSYLRV